jgi:hypothetical protein
MIGILLLALWYSLGYLLTNIAITILLEMHQSEEEKQRKSEDSANSAQREEVKEA